MRYPSSEKLEIIRLVEQSHLPAKRTLDTLGVPRTTFYRWYDRYLSGGVEALEDRCPKPGHVWNRIPDDIRERIVDLALEEPELSPRELAVRFTNTQSYFVSEASVYRLLKAHDLITSPAFVVIKAADEFRDKTTAINQMWQTDFTYLKVIGWGWFYLSTILDDFSRYIIAWKLCTTMKADDVTATLELALKALAGAGYALTIGINLEEELVNPVNIGDWLSFQVKLEGISSGEEETKLGKGYLVDLLYIFSNQKGEVVSRHKYTVLKIKRLNPVS